MHRPPKKGGLAHPISVLLGLVASYLCHYMLMCAHFDDASSRRRPSNTQASDRLDTAVSSQMFERRASAYALERSASADFETYDRAGSGGVSEVDDTPSDSNSSENAPVKKRASTEY